jgi:sortase A
MLGIYVGARAHRAVFSEAALERFKTEELRSPNQSETLQMSVSEADRTSWSQKRIQDYEASLAAHFAPAIGILRIPKIRVEVPVLEGTDDMTLNRGVGRIVGTANPGEDGNIGIAGHRDGFFRGLKDVAPGDTIELVTPRRSETYIIDRVIIVDPKDVSVLGQRSRPSLTLVTCYPFYFVGHAPQRYIVQATVAGSDAAYPQSGEQSTAKIRNVTPQ